MVRILGVVTTTNATVVHDVEVALCRAQGNRYWVRALKNWLLWGRTSWLV